VIRIRKRASRFSSGQSAFAHAEVTPVATRSRPGRVHHDESRAVTRALTGAMSMTSIGIGRPWRFISSRLSRDSTAQPRRESHTAVSVGRRL
jgi:hypothetical protein